MSADLQQLIDDVTDLSAPVTQRLTAAQQLEQLSDAGAVEALFLALYASDGELFNALAAALRACGAGQIEVARLQHRSPQIQQQAAERLALICDAVTTPALLSLLGDTDRALRACAARALIVLDDEGVEQALAQALTDSDPEVRAYAAAGLARYGGSAVAALEKALSQEADDLVSGFVEDALRLARGA